MPRPGTTITRTDARPSRSARTATGPWFIAGITGTADTLGLVTGPRTPVKSLTDYATRFGSRAAHVTATDPSMYDAVEFFFKEGGSEIFVVRTTDAVDATLTAALALFTRDLGPGQVSAPGRLTAAQRLIIANHARDNNRIAILDATNTAVVATLTAETTIAGITAETERVTSIWAPWVVVPGTTDGSTRTIAPSAIVAGVMSRNDGEGRSPNEPSAGALGESLQGIDVTQAWSDTDRTTLNVNGMNVLRDIYDGVRIYGHRTLSDPAVSLEANWLQLSNSRLIMGIQAQLDEVAERFVFREIDGRRLTINEFGGALTGVILPYWQRGSLYGATPEEAFKVDVGPNVNTDVTIAAGTLKANIALRTSPFAEEVVLEIVKTRITEAV